MFFNSTITFLLIYCSSIFSTQENKNELTDLGLKIEQGEKVFPIKNGEETIELSKEKFSLVFNLKKDDDIAEKFYAARLIADIDPDIFNQFDTDKSFEEIPSLSIGTSMAGPKSSPYECIFFDDQAHHYIFYNSEDERRANLISKEDELLQLKFDIENYCMQDLEVNIKNSNFQQIFLVFFIDKNLNERLEEGEFVKIEIDFQ